ncbi:hypothetical protein WOLCODRAFT_165373 [Wolfiporia cocos MD-104 SS10]|uniref:Uncharacterized protein n=1 Tax=Wolfiporia cocos (strain MD-104) TaxID=742152 RepID=A0A2H3JRG3_WOLCO|nr:hypothetical protein WOLCODRAFT_165373 [Wolfiporia cocos MD-104 SS10]
MVYGNASTKSKKKARWEYTVASTRAIVALQRVLQFKQQLPPEIWAIIFGCFIDDRQSLEACAFVCSAWLSVARPLLLRSVHIQDLPTCSEIDIALDRYPNIARYIHKLRVGPIGITDISFLHEEPQEVWQCCLRLLAKLEDVRELLVDLNGGWIDLAPHDLKGRLPKLLERVETLSLTNITCTGQGVQNILLACSRVSHLYLDRLYFPLGTRELLAHDATVNQRETIHTLVYTGRESCAPSTELLEWLVHGGINVNPSHLGFSRMSDVAWDMVHVAGSNLEYLWIDLMDPVHPRMAPALAVNTQLVSIDLIGFHYVLGGSWTALLHVLSHIGRANTSLRQLSLSHIGDMDSGDSIDPHAWREVDSHLARLAQSLPKLVVNLYFQRGFYSNRLHDMIIEILDNLTLYREARGRLTVCWSVTLTQYAEALDLKLMCRPDVDPGLTESL